MKASQKKLTQLAQIVDAWNKSYPVGTKVTLTKDDGSTVETTTRSQASIMGTHSAVIWLDGIAGCYSLSLCTPCEALLRKLRKWIAPS